MAWIVLGVATLLGSDARACWNNYRTEAQVVGVTPDGAVLERATYENEAADGPDLGESISLHDAGEHLLESLIHEQDRAGTTRWRHEVADEGGPLRRRHPERLRLPDNLRGATLAEASRWLARSLHATPLRPSAIAIRHNPRSATRCGSIEMKTRAGWAPVLEVGELDFYKERCVPVLVQAFEHASSGSLFVRTRWEIIATEPRYDGGVPDFAIDDRVHRFPRRRLESLALALEGKAALDAGRPGYAAERLEAAVLLEPGYAPAYAWVARAFAESRRDPDVLARLLDRPAPGKQVLGSAHGDDDLWSYIEHDAPPWLATAGDWGRLELGAMQPGHPAMLSSRWTEGSPGWPVDAVAPEAITHTVTINKTTLEAVGVLVTMPRLTPLRPTPAPAPRALGWICAAFALRAAAALAGVAYGVHRTRWPSHRDARRRR